MLQHECHPYSWCSIQTLNSQSEELKILTSCMFGTFLPICPVWSVRNLMDFPPDIVGPIFPLQAFPVRVLVLLHNLFNQEKQLFFNNPDIQWRRTR